MELNQRQSSKFSITFIDRLRRYLLLLILCLLLALITLFYTVFPNFKLNVIISPTIITANEIFVNKKQSNIIVPTFVRHSNHVEILDFILYPHPNENETYSIYLSGRRHSWTWSDIYCIYANSNKSFRGTIDRRIEEPFVVCPLPPTERQFLSTGTSHLLLSLIIHDKTFPNNSLLLSNISVPIYHHNRYNVSMYTMIQNKTEVLIEWIEYHRLIGVEHFYLYDHFSADNLDFILRSYLERQIVTIVRWSYHPLNGHHWNMMQSASMNHALKHFGPFNRWMGYFDVDEYFQIIVNSTAPLVNFLDQHFPESNYPGGVQFLNCPISCTVDETDLAASRYRILFEKCRHILSDRDCRTRTKLFIRPRNVPIMQNIHALEAGIQFAPSSTSSSLAQLRHYHYGTMLTVTTKNGTLDRSMDKFIDELKKRIITYL